MSKNFENIEQVEAHFAKLGMDEAQRRFNAFFTESGIEEFNSVVSDVIAQAVVTSVAGKNEQLVSLMVSKGVDLNSFESVKSYYNNRLYDITLESFISGGEVALHIDSAVKTSTELVKKFGIGGAFVVAAAGAAAVQGGTQPQI